VNLKRIRLSAGDARGLYAQYGFTELAEPSKMMTRMR